MREASPIKIWLVIVLVIAPLAIGVLFINPIAQAQTADQPQFLLTWQADGSYTPPNYTGKALPNFRSKILASLELISGGKLLNLKNQTIYWYINDTLIGGGQGVQSISFSPFGEAPSYNTLKVELPNYNGSLLIHTIQIPIIEPKAVIEAQHPSGQFSDNPLLLTAVPYFFETTDPSSLAFSWSVNGQNPTSAENPQILQVNMDPNTPSGSTFAISLNITSANGGTSAMDSTNLTYVKQL